MIGFSNFPGSIDTFETLLRLGLGVETYLKQPIDEHAMTLRVGDPTLLSVPTGVLQVDNEWITYSALVDDEVTVESRGAFLNEGGYQASPHKNGARVRQVMTPMHHRVLAEAIIAAQTVLAALTLTIIIRTNSVSVTNTSTNNVTATCGAGELLIGGGCDFPAGPSLWVGRNASDGAGGWRCDARNSGTGGPQTLTAQAICVTVPLMEE